MAKSFTFSSQYDIDSIVTVTIGGHKIRHCSISAIKFTKNHIRYDVTMPDTLKLYDLNAECVEGIEIEAEKIAESELK